MKTAYSQILLNLIVCFSLFTLSNCNDDCGPTPKVLIRDLGKYVPYTGNDTLRFLHNNTDTQTFVGQGLERFYVSSRRQQDTKCSEEDHESIRIRFVNPQTQEEIKMEYSYKPDQGGNAIAFAYKGINTSNRVYGPLKQKLIINSYEYDNVSFYSNAVDTADYIAFRSPFYLGMGSGILIVKYTNDNLTLIR